MRFVAIASGILLAGVSVQASGKVVTLTATGKVSSAQLYNQGIYTTAPTGKISVGDTFKLKALFDPEQAALSPYFNDPTLGFYYLIGSSISLQAGHYKSSFRPLFDFNATSQIWDDRIVSTPVDSQSFEFFNYNFAGPFPYLLTSAPIRSESIGVQSYDFTHSVRSDTLISNLISSSAPFSTNSMSYSFSTSDQLGRTYEIVQLGISDVSYSITSGVPEPTIWSILTIGFGAVGGAMRRRRVSGTSLAAA